MTEIRICATIPLVRDGASFDVLVVGSGAAGLAAAVSAERSGARVGLATKTTLQACNSAKAQGGIQAAFGDDDSPEIHAEDVMRSLARDGGPDARRGAHDRGSVARSTGSRRWASSSRGTARMAEAIRAPAATGSRAAAERRASGCSRSAIAPATRSRRRCARRTRQVRGAELPHHALRCDRSDGRRGGPRRSRRRTGRRRSRRAPSCSPPAGAASPRPRRAASSPRTIRTRPARSRGSRWTPAPRRATSTRSSTTRTAARGRRRCRATRSPRRRARTARSC